MNNEQCAMQHHSASVYCPQRVCGKNVWPDARYNFPWKCQWQCSIYELVQNIFPRKVNFQLRIYKKYSNI